MESRDVTAVVLCLGLVLSSAPVAAGSPSEDYSAARAAWQALEKDTKRQEYRHHWTKVIKRYEAVGAQHPHSGFGDDSFYMAGLLYTKLYRRTGLTADLAKARASFNKLISKYPQSRYADDAQFHIGMTWKTQKKLKDARRELRKVLDGYPKGDMRQAATRELVKLGAGPVATPTALVEATPQPTPTPEPTPSGPGELADVKVWSNPDYTRIVIYGTKEIEFKHAKLAADPTTNQGPRIYVDLEPASISPAFLKAHEKNGGGYHVPIGDGLLQQARVAQNTEDTVRVVLDLTSIEDYHVIPMTDPYFRILIDVFAKKRGGLMSARSAAAPTPTPDPKQIKARAEKIKKADRAALLRQFGLKVRTVVIDPGHGGKDTGAIGPKGKREKDVVLAISRHVAAKLRKEGLNVMMTRNDDTYKTLEGRTALANKLGADLFVSIHANASPNPAATGTEVYFLATASDADAARVAARENAMTEKKVSDLDKVLEGLLRYAHVGMSADLAQSILDQTVAHKKKKRRLAKRGVKTAPFYVLLTSDMPSVLVECAFISNKGEEAMLADKKQQEEIAEGVAQGVQKYLERLSLAVEDKK